jgi:hypothetical protein
MHAFLSALAAILVFLVLYLVFVVGVGVAAALSGAEQAVPVNDAVVCWGGRVFAVLVAATVSWKVWRNSRAWKKRWTLLLIGAAGLLAGMALLVCLAWPMLEIYDSDIYYISRERIDNWLGGACGAELPRSAFDVHAIIIGGIDPTLVLKFEGKIDENRRFVDRVLESQDMGAQTFRKNKPYATYFGKSWWKPSEKVLWWNVKDSQRYCQITLDESTGTVHLRLTLQ